MSGQHIIVARPPQSADTFFVQSDTMLTAFRHAANVYLKRADAEKVRMTWETSGRGWTFGIEPVGGFYG